MSKPIGFNEPPKDMKNKGRDIRWAKQEYG